MCVLKTDMTKSILWIIPEMTLALLIHMQNTLKKILRKKKSLKIQIKTQSLNQNYKTFIRILITTYHHQQWTQVSWLSTIMNQKTSLLIRNVFDSITADSYVEKRWTKSKNNTKFSNSQLYVGSISHMTTHTNMLFKIISIKCYVQIINGRKPPAKVFCRVIVKIPKINISILLWPSYCVPQNPPKTISQTALKH